MYVGMVASLPSAVEGEPTVVPRPGKGKERCAVGQGIPRARPRALPH